MANGKGSIDVGFLLMMSPSHFLRENVIIREITSNEKSKVAKQSLQEQRIATTRLRKWLQEWEYSSQT